MRPGARIGCVLLALLALSRGHAQGPAPVRAFTGALLIDGTDRQPLDNATLLVRDGRIAALGPAKLVTVPPEAERVALTGKIVIPGLINTHGHVNRPDRDLEVYAAYGVTTVFSLGDEAPGVIAARDAQRTPALKRARVFTTGPVLAPASPEDARTLVDRAAARRVDAIKFRVDDTLGTVPKLAPAAYRALIDAARGRGLRTAVHVFYLADAKAVVDAGADFLAHSVRDTDVDTALLSALKARGICVSPTLMREVSTFVYESAPPFFSDPLFLAHADPKWVADLQAPAAQQAVRTSEAARRYKLALDIASRNLKKMADAGVTIAMGTDSGPVGRFQGYFELMELELMVQAGLSPRQALLAATRDAARCHKLDAELGTLEARKWADFVVLNGDPLTNISNVRAIDAVYVAGNKVSR